MSARFSGPYTVDRRLSDTDYVIRTPDMRRKTKSVSNQLAEALPPYRQRPDWDLQWASCSHCCSVGSCELHYSSQSVWWGWPEYAKCPETYPLIVQLRDVVETSILNASSKYGAGSWPTLPHFWVLWKKLGFPLCLHYSPINRTNHWILVNMSGCQS